jgi:RNA polymerase sigma-70 factor (ECF subfamily)
LRLRHGARDHALHVRRAVRLLEDLSLRRALRLRDQEVVRMVTRELAMTHTTELLVQHHRELLRYVERRVGNRALAEDILQDAFVRGLEREGEIRESALGWMYRLLRNAVIDHARRDAVKSARLQAFAAELASEAEAESEWTRVACRCVVDLAASLKPEYAEALREVDVGGALVKDFAASHGISASNAGVRVFRARDALRKQVARACGTCAEHGCVDCTCGAAPHA